MTSSKPMVTLPAKLWLSEAGEAFASISVARPTPHTEHWPIASRRLEAFVTSHLREKGQTNTARAVADLVDAMKAEAELGGVRFPAYRRVATAGQALYLDLCDPAWRVVCITASGWSVLDQSPVRFVRGANSGTLPEPARGGSIDRLGRFLNLAEQNDFILAVAWLLAALRPKGPYPLIALTGEQGSSKSTTARVLRSLIDPTKPDLRSLPSSERDLMVAAEQSWVLAFDNLSGISSRMSDALCRLATGAGFGVRQHYSDKEEVVFDAARPMILNGIADVGSQPDLVDRAITLTLPPIPAERRRTEADFWLDFEREFPFILGALLDAAAGALACRASLPPTSLPRMADFAQWGRAVERAVGWEDGAFLRAYEANRSRAARDAVDGDVAFEAVVKFVQSKGRWEGTSTDLLGELRMHCPVSATTKNGTGLPSAPNKLSEYLSRQTQNLERAGVLFLPRRTGERRLISLIAASSGVTP